MEAGLANVENRILLITDAQPNTGDFSVDGLTARMKANAADGIFTTVVGESCPRRLRLGDGTPCCPFVQWLRHACRCTHGCLQALMARPPAALLQVWG